MTVFLGIIAILILWFIYGFFANRNTAGMPAPQGKETFPSNCLIVALWFFMTRGGYLVMRKSRLESLLPHFFWVEDFGPDVKMKNFVPIDSKPLLIPPPLFEGYIKTHDRKNED